MALWELVAIALGLSMDAFAVSVGKGLATDQVTASRTLTVGLYFGGFQALMPLIGFAAGSQLATLISEVDHWVAFGLLTLIGGKMLLESRDPDGGTDPSFGAASMLPLAIATSIDALAVGVTFALLGVAVVPAAALIGAVTFLVSGAGLHLGGIAGRRWRSSAELLGGLVLIAIGARILAEHLGWL